MAEEISKKLDEPSNRLVFEVDQEDSTVMFLRSLVDPFVEHIDTTKDPVPSDLPTAQASHLRIPGECGFT